MPNDFQSIESGNGLLKESYQEAPISVALKERRKKALEKAKPTTPVDQLTNANTKLIGSNERGR